MGMVGEKSMPASAGASWKCIPFTATCTLALAVAMA